MNATIAPDGTGGFIATVEGVQTSHRFYVEALGRLRALGLAQATSSQAAQRGHVEEWVPVAAKPGAADEPTPVRGRVFVHSFRITGEIDFGASF